MSTFRNRYKRAWVKVKDKRLKKPKLNSVKDDDGYHADKSESEEAEQSSSDYCPSEDSFVSTGLTGLLVLRDQPQRKRLVSQDDLHSERCIEPALRLSTGQSSQTGSLDLLAKADIVYSQSQPEDRVNEDDNSEQNGETASRADDDQNSVESNDEENFTESDQSKTSIKSNDEENFTARDQSKTWMKSDDEENFTARDQSKTWMKIDDVENFTESDQSKTSMKSDDEGNFTESNQRKTSMESDDEENFTESDQSKTSIESDEEGNFTESDLSKSSMNIDDEEDFSGCDLSLSNSGYLENEFFEYLQYVVSCCLDPEFVNCADSQDELKISKTKIETKIEDLKKMLESEAWTQGYQEAMETFPTLSCSRLEEPLEGCEACQRQGRIASKAVTFMGTPYEMDTENFECEEAGSQRELTFEVGRYCERRSRFYHRVFHYRYHLRENCVVAVNRFSKSDITADVVLKRCINDETWTDKTYREFLSLIDNVNTWFAAVYDR